MPPLYSTAFTKGAVQVVTATGFSNVVRAAANSCLQARVQATGAVSGDSVTANTNPVYVLVTDGTAPVAADKAKAIQLAAGAFIDVFIDDTSKIFIIGANNDTVRIQSFR